MASITFVEAIGSHKIVDAKNDLSLILTVRDHGIEGLAAECGGSLNCGTCHAFVAEDWFDRLPAPSEDERMLLEYVTNVRPNSRLICQITVSEMLDGMVIEIPALA